MLHLIISYKVIKNSLVKKVSLVFPLLDHLAWAEVMEVTVQWLQDMLVQHLWLEQHMVMVRSLHATNISY